MKSNWDYIKLGDATKFTSGGTPSKKKDEYWNGKIPWISAKTMKRERVHTSDSFITEEGLAAGSKLAPKGSILLLTRGSGLFNGIPICMVESPVAFNQDVKCITSTCELENEFIFYWLISITKYLSAKVGTTGIGAGKFDTKFLENLNVPFPPADERRKIIKIGKQFTDKLFLNEAIIELLEKQIRDIYAYYFVENRQDDWPVIPLSDIFYFQEGPGIRNWQYVTENGTRFINIRCINNGDIDVKAANMISDEEANGKYAHFMLKPNDIVMSCSGTLGRYAIVREEHLPLCLNTSVIRFSPLQQKEDLAYLYGYLSSPEFLNRQAELACGSVQANFGPTHLKQMTLRQPPKEIRREFSDRTLPLINQTIQLRKENELLREMRNNLLPELFDGEIECASLAI